MNRVRNLNTSRRSVIEYPDSRDECQAEILTLWHAEMMDQPEEAAEQRKACLLHRIQGAWISISGHRQAELLISGHHLTIHFNNGDIYMGPFTLGLAGRFTTLDVQIEEGPARYKGLAVLSICAFDGDTLVWCNAAPGELQRPTAFDDHNPHLLSLRFRHEDRVQPR